MDKFEWHAWSTNTKVDMQIATSLHLQKLSCDTFCLALFKCVTFLRSDGADSLSLTFHASGKQATKTTYCGTESQKSKAIRKTRERNLRKIWTCDLVTVGQWPRQPISSNANRQPETLPSEPQHLFLLSAQRSTTTHLHQPQKTTQISRKTRPSIPAVVLQSGRLAITTTVLLN